MLEEPATLGPRERDDLRLAFAVWRWKQARRFHCEGVAIDAVVLSRAKPVVEAVAGSAMSEGAAVAASPETAETGSRLDAGRTASATSETMDVTGGESAASFKGPDKSGGELEASPAPSMASRLRALNAEHPEFTVAQAAEALGLDRERVRNNSNAHKIRWATKGVQRRDLNEKVAALHRQHRDWPPSKIASELSCAPEYVRATGQRMGFMLPAERDYKAQQSRADARPRASAPEPSDEPQRLPALARAPIAAAPSGTGGAIQSVPMRRPPRGQQFWLRNDAGEYLDRFCTGFTRDRREAWTGSQDQLAACRRHFSIAVDLIERPVEKEQSRAVA